MTREEARTALGDRNNLLWGMSKEEQKYYSEALDMAISALSENKGEWIAEDIHNCCTEFKCSKCGYTHNFVHLYGKPTADYTYCPYCGADMRGET